MKKAKIVVGILSLIMSFTLIGCGDDKPKNMEGLIQNEDGSYTVVEETPELEFDENADDESIPKVKFNDLKIDFTLKEENKVKTNFEYDHMGMYEEENFEPSKKVIQYSLKYKSFKDTIYLGYYEGVNEDGTNGKMYFIENNSNGIYEYYYDMYGGILNNNWKDALFLVDLDKKDDKVEICIKHDINGTLLDMFNYGKNGDYGYITNFRYSGNEEDIYLRENRMFLGEYSYTTDIHGNSVLYLYYEMYTNEKSHYNGDFIEVCNEKVFEDYE